MERMRIVINFKNTEEDIRLYEELKRHSSISGYVKDILKGIINTSTVDRVENTDTNDDIFDDINDIIGG